MSCGRGTGRGEVKRGWSLAATRCRLTAFECISNPLSPQVLAYRRKFVASNAVGDRAANRRPLPTTDPWSSGTSAEWLELGQFTELEFKLLPHRQTRPYSCSFERDQICRGFRRIHRSGVLCAMWPVSPAAAVDSTTTHLRWSSARAPAGAGFEGSQPDRSAFGRLQLRCNGIGAPRQIPCSRAASISFQRRVGPDGGDGQDLLREFVADRL